MNPSSLDLFFSAVQRQKDMHKLFSSMLFDDEGSHAAAEASAQEHEYHGK